MIREIGPVLVCGLLIYGFYFFIRIAQHVSKFIELVREFGWAEGYRRLKNDK